VNERDRLRGARFERDARVVRHPLAVDQHVTHERAVQDVGVGGADTWSGGGKRGNINHGVSFGDEIGRLRDEKLTLVPALPQYFPLHRHELQLALRIKRTIGLVAEQ
jgi:hypothetical protein